MMTRTPKNKSFYTHLQLLGVVTLLTIEATAGPRVTRTPANSPLYELALANVVRIELWEKGQVVKFGSGFFAKNDGTIITNAHVIEEALDKPYKVKIRLSNGYTTENIFIGACRDKKNVDLCALKVSDKRMRNTPALAIYDSDRVAESGTPIFSFGHPKAIPWAMSKGVVTHILKLPDTESELISITSPLAPGSSGGPVLNQWGDVVGVVSSQVSYENALQVGVAISHRELKSFLERKVAFQLLEVARALKDETPHVLNQKRVKAF